MRERVAQAWPATRALLSIGLLALVLRKVSLREVLHAMAAGMEAWPLLLAAFLLPALGFIIAGQRWKILLTAQGISTSIFTLVKALLVGSYFNQILPSTIGGDVVRSWWLPRPVGVQERGWRLLSLTVVGVDRLVGVLGILATALLAAAATPSVVRKFPQLWGVFFSCALAAAAILLFAPQLLRFLRGWTLRRGALRGIHDKVQLVYEGVAAYKSERWRLTLATLLSVLLQIAIILEYVLLAGALRLNVPLWQLGALIPVVTLLTLIPVTVNGIGVRESALVVLGAPLGVHANEALALAWLYTVGSLLYACGGALVHGWGRKDKSPTVPESVYQRRRSITKRT